jgi:hypothetical protein
VKGVKPAQRPAHHPVLHLDGRGDTGGLGNALQAGLGKNERIGPARARTDRSQRPLLVQLRHSISIRTGEA